MHHSIPESRARRIAALCSSAGKGRVLALAGVMIVIIAVSDWAIGINISLGVLYTIPIILTSFVLPTRHVLALAFVCAVFRMLFDSPGSVLEASLRFVLALIAFVSVGLCVEALLQNQQQTAIHLI